MLPRNVHQRLEKAALYVEKQTHELLLVIIETGSFPGSPTIQGAWSVL